MLPDTTIIGLPSILVVVPVYNHEATLRGVVAAALARHPHVLVVDDGSTDMPAAPVDSLTGLLLPGTGHPCPTSRPAIPAMTQTEAKGRPY